MTSGSSSRPRSCVNGSMRTTPPPMSCGSATTGRGPGARRSTGRPPSTRRSASAGSMASGNALTTTAHVQRFTPRRPRSTWSAVNVAKVASLTAEGRMRPAGLAAFAARAPRRTPRSTRTSGRSRTSATRNWRDFEPNETAWADWQARPPSYRRPVTHWVTSAKQPATRERRLATLIEDSAAGRKVKQMRWSRDDR